MQGHGIINTPESMIAAIREYGIIPFFKGNVPGWSVQELTDPGCWFTSSDELGPWDWKIDAVREGDIAYGKFIRNKAAFATATWYGHLMNWRRSLPQYRIPVGEAYPGNNLMDRLYKALSPTILEEIRARGSVGTSELRKIIQEKADEEELRKVGGSLEKYLFPKIKRTALDFVNQYLEMGTWTVIGDFTRVYRGMNLEYSGWQRCSITTPDELFRQDSSQEVGLPCWAKMFNQDYGRQESIEPDCTPEESRQILISHIKELTGADAKTLEKLI